MSRIFDVHAHYDDQAFDDERDQLLNSMLNSGEIAGIINAATDLETILFGIEYSGKYKNFFTSIGFHPEKAQNAPDDFIEKMAEFAKNESVVAIGEIGLDYYWKDVAKEVQIPVFEKQLALARELDMPVVIHDRDAHGDVYDLLRKYRPKGIVHCFSGSVELMREVVKLGMSISLGGVVTFKNARRCVEVARDIPLDRLMLETDAPYMAPVPYRGKRCDSRMISFTAAKIAEIKNITVDKLLGQNIENACRAFGVKL